MNKILHMRVCIRSTDRTTYAMPLSDTGSCSQDWVVHIMFFPMISRRSSRHLYAFIWKYHLHNDFWEILKFCTSSCALCPRFMRPKQRLISGQLHVMGKLHMKFQENQARNVLSVKNRNTYVMKFSFFEKNIFCLKSYRSAAWQDILHKKENQSLDLSFF